MVTTRTLCVLSLVFCTFFAQAQLSKGTMTVGASGNIGFSFIKSTQNNNTGKNNGIGLSAYPSVGYFLSSRWMLGSGIGVGFSTGKQKNAVPSPNISTDLTSRSFNFRINPFMRYYLKNTEKTGIFLFAGAQYYGGKTTRKNNINPNFSSSSFEDYFDWSAGIGMQRMINPQIAIEGSLSYGDSKSIYLGFGLCNFVTMADKSEAVEGYITKGRLLTEGNAGIGYFTNTSTVNFSYSIFMGKMLSDRFMIGSGSYLRIGDSDYLISLSPQVRYYIPVTKRLFVYPYIGGQFSAQKTIVKYSSISFDRGIGYNYFLTKYVALTGDFNGNLSSYKEGNRQNRKGNASINMGITQFIR
jgi:hypothetical protein